MRTMRMVAKAVGPVVAAVTLSLLLAGGAWAKPVLQEDFTAAPKGMHGGEIVNVGKDRGWRGPGGDSEKSRDFVEYDLASLKLAPEKGTIEFDLTRGEVFRREAAFSLMNVQGERLFVFRIYWDGVPDAPALYLNSANRGEMGRGFWHPVDPKTKKLTQGMIPLQWRGGAGKTAHIALTWDGNAGAILVDGRRLSVVTDPTAPFSALVAAADKLVVGAEFDNRVPRGAWSVSHSVISNFQVNSEALTAAELGGPISAQPSVASVEHDAARVAGFSGKLVAGNSLGVTVNGTPGAAGSFDIVHYPDVYASINLDWRGWGVYVEEKTFFAEGEVNLREVDDYEVYVAQTPFDHLAPGFEPVARLNVETQQYLLEALEVDKPYYIAVVAVMRDQSRRAVIAPISGRPLVEAEPGVYTGSYQVGWRDRYPRATVVARLESGQNAAESLAAMTFAVDPALTIAMTASPSELMADEKSTAKLTVTVTDANGNPVPEHEVKFQLFTTSQYTGVVGGGAFNEQVGATVKESSWGKTDLFGKVTATYVAGFAAKTAIIVARDMLSNDTGTAWVKTFIKATAQLELVPVAPTAAMDAGYAITVTSSDEWLTADGKSQARITARVTLNDQPVEGHKVAFAVSSGTGTVRVVKDTTDGNGEARALYTAGTKIGMVLVTATDTTAGISGSVQIELRSDAPAKIVLKIDPEKLPADGRSTANVSVLVTDINDNPNDNVQVEYALTEGGGRLRDDKSMTDRNGETSTEYTAGRSAGRVTIEITVRSTVPTDEELAKVRQMALAVKDYNFF